MRTVSTLRGAAAILLWSTLSVLTALTGSIPPFELAALTFFIGGSLGTCYVVAMGRSDKLLQPPPVWIGAVGGLFGYHALYFAALRLAPPAEAGLINYLWPLLIVLFSAFLPGLRLTARHLLAAALGFAGLVLMAHGRAEAGPAMDPTIWLGYGLALAAALVWAGYSVWSRTRAAVASEAVAGFCLATSLVAAVAHILTEGTVMPASPLEWGAIVALGLGPVGLAFFLWDDGVKRGDLRLLAILSYGTPVLSTGLLVMFGMASPTRELGLACLLIAVAGAVGASRPPQKKKPAMPPA